MWAREHVNWYPHEHEDDLEESHLWTKERGPKQNLPSEQARPANTLILDFQASQS